MIRRIEKEFEMSNLLSNHTYDKNTRRVTFTYKNRLNVQLNLKLEYPFRSPENIHINGRKIYYNKIGNHRALVKYFNVQCLCCKSMICPNNWKCTYRFEKLIEEYEMYKTIARGSLVLDYLEKEHIVPTEILHIIARFCGDKL